MWVFKVTSGPFCLLGREQVPTTLEAEFAPGMVCTGAENLAHPGIRSLDRLAHSESLYQLSYPGPRK
jgi:hypothetical protein